MISLFYIAWKNLRYRPLASLLHALLAGLGVGLVALMLQSRAQLDRHLERNLGGVDLVIGAKGSEMQLLFSSLLHVDDPAGNIPLHESQRLTQHPMVSATIPLAIGDSYRGYRVVGCTPAYPELYGAKLRQGRQVERPFDVVAGSVAARALGLVPGDTFLAAHGLLSSGDHHAQPYTVTGVLAASGTAIDYLLLTPLESIWLAHSDRQEKDALVHDTVPDREITAMLVVLNNPLGLMMLSRSINEESALQAAVPAFAVARLRERLGIGTNLLRSTGLALIALAALGIFTSLYQALRERRYELALLRSMGARPGQLGRLLLLEGLFLACGGLLCGWALSRLGLMALQHALLGSGAPIWRPVALLPEEGWLAAGVLMMGLLAAAWPAWRARHTDVASVLGKGV